MERNATPSRAPTGALFAGRRTGRRRKAASAVWRLATLLITTLLASTGDPASAQPSLSLPLDCTIGETCFVEDYVDMDPEPGRQKDFACGINSRDGHRGTDFALLSFEAFEAGVTVRAAATGTVLRTRDGMADDPEMRGVTDQNACGNAVLLDHGEGWQTLYCHLARGSIDVRPGDTVAAGAALGDVGLSGQTNYPHVHFTVLHNGALVDPFRPEAIGTCGTPGQTLWSDPPPYTATGLITAGFSDGVPTLEAVSDGSARLAEGRTDAPLVVYAHAGYAEHGDLLTIAMRGPDGAEVFRHEAVLEAPQVSTMRAFGRRAPDAGWQSGDYLGTATLTRNARVIAHRFAHVTVP